MTGKKKKIILFNLEIQTVGPLLSLVVLPKNRKGWI
jgi:hypothetical protein